MKRTIKNLTSLLLIAAVSFTACKKPNDDTTEQKVDKVVELSGEKEIPAAQVKQFAADDKVGNITAKSKEDFQKMESAAMADFTRDLKKLYDEVNAKDPKKFGLSGTFNPKSINSSDSLLLTLMGALVKPYGGNVPDTCMTLQIQLAGLVQDSINGAKVICHPEDSAVLSGRKNRIKRSNFNEVVILKRRFYVRNENFKHCKNEKNAINFEFDIYRFGNT